MRKQSSLTPNGTHILSAVSVLPTAAMPAATSDICELFTELLHDIVKHASAAAGTIFDQDVFSRVVASGWLS